MSDVEPVLMFAVKYFLRGAVALDGRIEPGDMILQVNDINFENMSNDDAVRVLREVVQKPGYGNRNFDSFTNCFIYCLFFSQSNQACRCKVLGS